MNKIRKTILGLFTVLIITANVPIAMASPYSVTFIGNATINGIPIGPGINISAYLDGNLCGSTLSPENPENPGDYWNSTSNLVCTGDDSQIYHDINFTVNGHLAAEIGPDEGSLNMSSGVDGVPGWRRVNLAVTTSCGDGTCDENENYTNCPEDCSVCGDGACTGDENYTNCPEDCSVCGDGACTGDENYTNCPEDCSVCGDGACTGDENYTNCPGDCSVCGDGACTGDENYTNCPGDCSVCGDGACTGDENYTNCPGDCSVCGDGACTGTETCSNCPADCGACQNNMHNTQINIIDPPIGTDVCVNETTNITANITINASNPNDPLLKNVSVCVNVSCPGGYVLNEKQYKNFLDTLTANITFEVTPNATGTCTVMTCVDCNNTINETNENDNCGSVNFEVIDCSQQPPVPQQLSSEAAPVPALSQIGLLVLCILTVMLGIIKINKYR